MGFSENIEFNPIMVSLAAPAAQKLWSWRLLKEKQFADGVPTLELTVSPAPNAILTSVARFSIFLCGAGVTSLCSA